MEPEVKVNEDFKSQFKAYQEQQQRRLKNLMEAKKEKQDRQKNTGSTKEIVRALSDLNLFKKGPPVKEDASKSFFEAENEQLQDQLRELRDENCRLYRLMAEKDFEITELQKRVKEERLALSGVSGLAGDVAATKIVELAKKNREVTAEFESERARVKQLNHRVKELERELQAAAEKIHSLGGDAAGIKESALKKLEGNLAENPELKALQEKLSTANVKVTEYRNQLQNLKQELKLTQKILAKEVGEDVNIQSLLTNSGSWRGRAQQIVLLQSKVHELEHKLNHQKMRASLLEMDEGLLAFPDARKLSVQEKNLLKIRSLEKEKKESLEKLSEQHNTLQKNHEELKKKLDALRARNQMLCGEVKMLKGQIGTLLEKGKHDDELIDALLSQQKQMQEILKALSQKKGENKMMDPEIQKQNTLIDELRQSVADREAKVKTLEKEIGQLTHQDKSGAAHPPHSEHLGSPEAGRTESARSADTDSLSWEVLLGELIRQRLLCQPAEKEKGKLLELLAVLQKRVEESSDKALEAEKKLQEEQWQSDSLEEQFEKLQVDPESSTTAQEPALRSRKAQPSLPLHVSDREELSASLSELPLESQVEELSRRLGFQMDESKSLKAALKETVTAKGEDS
ncbi:coiled-coil domain-containing protein 13 [Geospiza fortis]|uniref:Coiled-coil domain-containing protein 13 n=1 Tax=Geospiza fortis TaxID=48883 RepID=A0A8N5EVM3_GEOFO|nr:coiled-coil domain-containing protein 13 [Camarhynchus parvulus]XP_030798961.1 coiled-coil domain-containing protein 13 [Camarhynchus parvulus]XP_030798962.1 coiled-coil domain-containing protein 13 [Camarhynchus parvulus]XP_030918809.1 coiled-coil domain-containing protein 13 [Geospiza fortis]XP_030918810.1 coiled-coil domain-containing protein 13 [Geospiza fortis]